MEGMMSPTQEMEIAAADLDELIDALERDIKSGGFKNKSVLWLMKAWAKIGILASGAGDQFRKSTLAYWIMKRTPPPAKEKRSKGLLDALVHYSEALENNHSRGGDYFTRANDQMRYFVWEFRAHISGANEKEFVHQLHEWMSMSKDKFMEQQVFNMDR
jgi:hypothetical protein